MADQVSSIIQRLRVLIGDMNDDVNEHRHSDNYLKKVLRVAIEQDAGLASIGLGGAVTSTGNSYIEYTIDGMGDAALSMYSLAASVILFEAELRQFIADGGGMAVAIGPNSVSEVTILQSLTKMLRDSKNDLRIEILGYQQGAGSTLNAVRIDLYSTGVVD